MASFFGMASKVDRGGKYNEESGRTVQLGVVTGMWQTIKNICKAQKFCVPINKVF